MKDQKFFTRETPKLQWALTNREVISNIIDKNYLEQTQAIADYLKKQVFPNEREMPDIYKEAIEQFERYYQANFKGKNKEKIEQMLRNNQKKYNKELIELKINQLCRQTPADVMYDTSIYFQNTGKRLLKRIYTWTCRLSLGGRLVAFGGTDFDGAVVSGWYPDNAYRDVGVVFSRSH